YFHDCERCRAEQIRKNPHLKLGLS
ncbi:putative 39S ribosomal protein L45, partial [Danaus plexippus plexippus]